ncbi:hypothetical protein [Paenibacillus sp. SYP-B4298]|uniref:hypothetical protein n=1 Tax=Paenibacillus sp. SYP-B4298 TaxID=2996034 RepID=UPI0022DDCB0E|nr:hypothetical protein [Paenibacillus sp. SYP-B4298]
MKTNERISSQNTPTIHDAVTHLIESIASEDKALSRLLNTEAEHILAFSQENIQHEKGLDLTAIIKFNQSVIQFMDTVVMAEWILMKKLDTMLHMQLHTALAQQNGMIAEETEEQQERPDADVLDAEQMNELESFAEPWEWNEDEWG